MMSERTVLTTILTLALAVVITGACFADGDSYDIKVYPCARAAGEIVIDGDLTEAAWEHAPVVDEFTYHNRPEPVDVQTHVRVLYTDSDLLLGIRFDEPNMDRLTPVGQPRDSMGVFHGEAVEIFVDPDHDQEVYHQIAINAAESIYDSRKTDPSWSADVRAGVTLLDDAWTMEVAIPWADLGVQPERGALVGLNVCRDRHLGPNKTWSTWSQVEANFHDPERFGHIVLSPSASRIGELADEFRKGGRVGPIVIYGPQGFVRAAYRAIGMSALAEAEELLERLEAMQQAETDAGAREELGRRTADYRAELAEFEQTTRNEQVSPDRWLEMNHRIAQIRDELGTVIWEARLTALLSGI
jgi:hypothetical protein